MPLLALGLAGMADGSVTASPVESRSVRASVVIEKIPRKAGSAWPAAGGCRTGVVEPAGELVRERPVDGVAVPPAAGRRLALRQQVGQALCEGQHIARERAREAVPGLGHGGDVVPHEAAGRRRALGVARAALQEARALRGAEHRAAGRRLHRGHSDVRGGCGAEGGRCEASCGRTVLAVRSQSPRPAGRAVAEAAAAVAASAASMGSIAATIRAEWWSSVMRL